MRTAPTTQVPVPDPSRDQVVLQPERSEPGYWVGSPSVLSDPVDGRFLLTYRSRRPRGSNGDRGWRGAVAASNDGLRFEDLWEVRKQELDTPSMERFCLHRRRDGHYQLYVSYVDPVDNRWRIDVTGADAPDRFDVRQRRAVLTASATGTEGVKDPVIVQHETPGHLSMLMSTAKAELTGEERAAAHATADIFTTGVARSVTGLAESLDDGDTWRWTGVVFRPGTGWDRWAARITAVLRVADGYVGYYDGAAHHRDNYEEMAGLARSKDLRVWERLTTDSPLVVSPHSTGSLRYVDVVRVGSAAYLYYELAMSSGGHELRVHVSADELGGPTPMP